MRAIGRLRELTAEHPLARASLLNDADDEPDDANPDTSDKRVLAETAAAAAAATGGDAESAK